MPPPKKRKIKVASEASKPPKKRFVNPSSSKGHDGTPGNQSMISVTDLYNLCVVDGTEDERLSHINDWDERGALEEVIWKSLVTDKASKDGYLQACRLLALFVSHRSWEGSFGSMTLRFMKEKEAIEKVLQTLITDQPDAGDLYLMTKTVHFLIVALSVGSTVLYKCVSQHLTSVDLLHWIPERRRELELKKSAGLRRKLADTAKRNHGIVTVVNQVLELLEGTTQHGIIIHPEATVSDDADGADAADKPAVPVQVWFFLQRSLELIIDLLSETMSRRYLIIYLDSIHFKVRCNSVLGREVTTPENARLVRHLLTRVNRLLSYPIDYSTQKHQSKVDVVSMHHSRAAMLQKMAHRYHPTELQQVIYAGVGLLCSGQKKASYLERTFIGFSDEKLDQLLYKLRLVPEPTEEKRSRAMMMQIIGDFLAVPPYPEDQLRSFPLYPTEKMLWDHNIIPPSRRELRVSPVLALPKLNTRFLSFQDYLIRNFELIRLESAYEIRSDLVNVAKRVHPILRQFSSDDKLEMEEKTEFNGWSRMALEMVEPFQLLAVHPPKLGQTTDARVLAEVAVDLDACGESIRQEWDEIGEFDNIFLLAFDASESSGGPAPLLSESCQHSSAHGRTYSDSTSRVPDDEDRTFPQRYGLTAVRGCMVVQVKNGNGKILSDPGVETSNEDRKDTKRVFRVEMDPAQYARDSKQSSSTSTYETFNLVVRRHGRENNFKSILQTIRGLLEGSGSISRVLPGWLQSLILGNGDPSGGWYKSPSLRSYAMKTVGVNNPTDFLDFCDTFLDAAHLRECFPGKFEIVDRNTGVDESKSRSNYKIKFVEDDGDTLVKAVPVPFPDNVAGNPVRFTTRQVEAIRSGLSPGLTLVVGPPGTGKTDVAVQIISSLYKSFPTQRTVIITHSNAALNDIFKKVMARGDVEERYLLRLGSGERDLDTESTHDFTKLGRVAFSLQDREELLLQVQDLAESLGISSKEERGPGGTSSYTCESSSYFWKNQIARRRRSFDQLYPVDDDEDQDVTSQFPFLKFFQAEQVTLAQARKHLKSLDKLFEQLEEYRPFELLRTQRQRADFLITKQAKIVAMTCTHAAIARANLTALGFEYDNLVMEESGQMLEIETFIPMLLQKGRYDGAVAGLSRLKRVCMLGDHNQLPPVVQNASFSKFSNLDQSLFARLIGLDVPYIQLDKQGRSRPELMKLYSWRYADLGNLPHVTESHEYKLANPGFVHRLQLINVNDFEGKGENTPTPFYYQNLGEAEYVVAMFQYMVMIGYSPDRISILSTYFGQTALISDIVSKRCGRGTPLEGIRPKAVSTVDKYQGQQNDIILLSLVRTKSVGHLRDIRRLVVAVSRARLGLYIFCRKDIFCKCHELKTTMDQLLQKPTALQLVLGETVPSNREVGEAIKKDSIFNVEDVGHLGSIVHTMQEEYTKE